MLKFWSKNWYSGAALCQAIFFFAVPFRSFFRCSQRQTRWLPSPGTTTGFCADSLGMKDKLTYRYPCMGRIWAVYAWRREVTGTQSLALAGLLAPVAARSWKVFRKKLINVCQLERANVRLFRVAFPPFKQTKSGSRQPLPLFCVFLLWGAIHLRTITVSPSYCPMAWWLNGSACEVWLIKAAEGRFWCNPVPRAAVKKFQGWNAPSLTGDLQSYPFFTPQPNCDKVVKRGKKIIFLKNVSFLWRSISLFRGVGTRRRRRRWGEDVISGRSIYLRVSIYSTP